MRRLALALASACACAACDRAPDIALAIRLPSDRRLLAGVTRLDLSAVRDARVLAEQTFAAPASFVAVSGVPRGPNTVFELAGSDELGDVLGIGRTCPIDYQRAGLTASLYFAPSNFFAPTPGAPPVTRADALALPLADGTVLLAGGVVAGAPASSGELFDPGSGAFAAGPSLNVARAEAEVASVPGIGALVSGGVDASGAPLGDAEVYTAAVKQFLPLAIPALVPRVGHRALALPDGRVLLTGGRSSGDATLASTVFVRLMPDGSGMAQPGPPLVEARYDHALVVADGVPVVIGGFATDGSALTTLEALLPSSGGAPASFATIARLASARAEATATLLDDGTLLIAGGAGDAAGTPLPDAEVYNPITRTTTVFPMAAARRGHTATKLANGRVLILGGTGAGGRPLTSVELFAPAIGFVSEHPLGAARAGHVAIPLCDGTVLVVGGAPGAEIYTPPAR